MASLKQKVAFSTFAQIAGRLTQMLLGLVTVTILTRYLGIHEYGNYAIIFVYAGFAAAFADFGTTQLIVREASQQKASVEELLGSGFLVNAGVGLVIFLLFAATLQLLPYEGVVKAGAVIALAGVFIGNLNFYGSFFYYQVRQDIVVAVETLGRVLSIGLLVWLVKRHASMLSIVALSPITVGISAIVGSLLVLRRGVWPKINRRMAISILRQSIPLGIIAVLGLIHFKIDSLILSLIKSPDDVAIYSVAYKVVELLVVMPTFFMSAMFPVLSAAYAAKNDFQVKAQLTFDFIMLLGVPALVGSFLLAPQMVSLLGSSNFAPAAGPLRILVFGVLISYVTLYHNILAIVANLQKRLIPLALASVAVNIVANLVLIPMFSYHGAAVSTIISEAVGMLLTAHLINKHVGLQRSFKRLPRIAAAVIVMGLAIDLFPIHNLFLGVATGAAIYGLAVLVFKAVTVQELKSLLPQRLSEGN